ncbi:hypothetical protein HMPREF9695_04459 [Afipia broomeae ATCC 49717]|jgi:hypothetical protein|uniref:Uncharacterized protein n=1 Tax=Afipia broomeae ATCC 49717 TaxID=883078 RepID=K8P1D1_9BRAD|nr:hypothetical protein HMPREF9695_04459 [Afipia broomeae ATCC 49717]
MIGPGGATQCIWPVGRTDTLENTAAPGATNDETSCKA